MNQIVASIEAAATQKPRGDGGCLKAVATELKELRQKHNLSQKEFAERFGLPLTSIQNWESKVRKSKPDATARLLIDMIKTDADGVARIVANSRVNDGIREPT